ncbi:hypothetical protein P2318_16450 [Myxococcaceae bacterium GXIMD 01537]
MQVRGREVMGPYTSLSVDEDGMRGRFGGAPVNLAWNGEELIGQVGGRMTGLVFATEGAVTHINGNFAGVAVEFNLEGPWLKGRFGTCNYDTELTPEGFVGKRDCPSENEEVEQFRLFFPPDIGQRPRREELGLVVLGFAADATRNFNGLNASQPTKVNQGGMLFSEPR